MYHLKKKMSLNFVEYLIKKPNQASTACRFLISMTLSMYHFLHCTNFKDINKE